MTTLGDRAVTGVRTVGYGLELTVERGTGWGPKASDSSARPMHSPELWPVQGMPSTDGRSGLPGMLLNVAPEFGTVCGMQTPVNVSSSSPPGHWATGTEALGTVTTAIAGAAATATANPQAMISRRTESSRVAIVTLSVVSDHLVGRILWKLREICIRSTSSLRMRPLGLRILPSYGLELMVERGTGCGPAAASSSESPMQAPESRPVHGMPLISGMSGLAAVDVNPCGEFGTKNGVHEVVKTSSSSPVSHAARGLESVACVGCPTIATAGAMAIATANPPARIRRRAVMGYVVIELLSVVVG
jgi:hypothetical protein